MTGLACVIGRLAATLSAQASALAFEFKFKLKRTAVRPVGVDLIKINSASGDVDLRRSEA